jgi:hypothetical protein
VRIGGVEISAADVSWLEREARKPECTRSDLARLLCDRRKLVDAVGQPRVITARIDLSRHARAGRLSLPKVDNPFRARERGVAPTRKGQGERATEHPEALAELGPLTVHRVGSPSDPWHAAWTKSLIDHHYLGAGPLCGAQLRYVVCAGQRVVAAVSFSAAALHVAARDKFIGWSAAARHRNRSLVISQSRFCLTVRVKNLASRVQALLLKRVGDDWEQVYGRRPVLAETYVDTERFDGTCYLAANWQRVGRTSGRGRQDRDHGARASIKEVFTYPLDGEWRATLCVEPVRALDPNQEWAQAEWGSVDLGDQRMTQRLVAYGRACFQRPTANVPQTCGSLASTRAAYRLLHHPSANLETLLSGHRETTLARAAEHPVVLAIQDTTSINYTSHRSTTGLGPIASFGGDATRGLLVHSLLLSDLAGTPLGLLDINAWVRDPEKYGKTAEPKKHRPTEEKESQKWIRGYAAADAAAQRLDNTHVVVVGDREADMFDLLKLPTAGHPDVLVRATARRRHSTPEGKDEGSLWDSVAQEPIAGRLEIQVPRSGPRPARRAQIELRYRDVNLPRPPKNSYRAPSLRVWAVTATESTKPGDGIEPIEWRLLTTMPVETFEAAAEKVRWYTRRWLIEVFHRTLKSGCRIEQRQSSTAESLEAALAIDAVVAWRVMALVKLGREVPDMPCSTFFEESEWKALYCFTKQTKAPPEKAPSMNEAIRMIAALGGHLGRSCDGPPGMQTVWRGLDRFSDIAEAYRLFFSSG